MAKTGARSHSSGSKNQFEWLFLHAVIAAVAVRIRKTVPFCKWMLINGVSNWEHILFNRILLDLIGS
jgi:hypothetical protein